MFQSSKIKNLLNPRHKFLIFLFSSFIVTKAQADLLIPTSLMQLTYESERYYAIEMKRIADPAELPEDYLYENLGIPDYFGKERQLAALKHLHRIGQLITIHAKYHFYWNYLQGYQKTADRVSRRGNKERFEKIKETMRMLEKKKDALGVADHWEGTTSLLYLFQYKMDLRVGAIREVFPSPDTGKTVGEMIAGVHSPRINFNEEEVINIHARSLLGNLPIFGPRQETESLVEVSKEKREIKSTFASSVFGISPFSLLLSAVRASDFFGLRQSLQAFRTGVNKFYLPGYLLLHAREESGSQFEKLGFEKLSPGDAKLDDFCQYGQSMKNFKSECYGYLKQLNDRSRAYFEEGAWKKFPFPLLTVREFIEQYGGDLDRELLNGYESFLLEKDSFIANAPGTLKRLWQQLSDFSNQEDSLIHCVYMENQSKIFSFHRSLQTGLIRARFWDGPNPFQQTFTRDGEDLSNDTQKLTLNLHHLDMPTLSMEPLPEGRKQGIIKQIIIEPPENDHLRFQQKIKIVYEDGSETNYENCSTKFRLN